MSDGRRQDAKPVQEEAGPQRVKSVKREIFDWAPSQPWWCPRCGLMTLTTQAAPRCRQCGYVESGT